MNSIVTNEDCMVGMARYPDKWFELAIVDRLMDLARAQQTAAAVIRRLNS